MYFMRHKDNQPLKAHDFFKPQACHSEMLNYASFKFELHCFVSTHLSNLTSANKACHYNFTSTRKNEIWPKQSRFLSLQYCRSRSLRRKILSWIWFWQTFRKFLFLQLSTGSRNLHRSDIKEARISVPK